MGYKTVVREIEVFNSKTGTLGEGVSVIRVEDEGGGSFVRISQPLFEKENMNTIDLDPEEIPVIMQASMELLENYNSITSEEEEE